jgi:hypothetical protein
MAGLEESEVSALYESVEMYSDSGDEYVSVSQPTPYIYMCPEPKESPPPPPSKQTKKPKLRQQLPPLPTTNTTHLLKDVNALPLPRKPHPIPKKSIKYKKLGSEVPSPAVKPKRPPKPGYLAGSNAPVPPIRYLPRMDEGRQPQAMPPTYPSQQQGEHPYHRMHEGLEYNRGIPPPTQHNQQQDDATNEPQNEYDSIKETRRMMAKRRVHRERARTPESATEEDMGGDGEGVQMKTFPRNVATESHEEPELMSSGESGRLGQPKVVGILLSIAMVSVLIAMASLALALYSVTAITTRRVICHHDIYTNSTLALSTSPSSTKTAPFLEDELVRRKEGRGEGRGGEE